MTTTELPTEQEEMWRTFFDDNHTDLAIAAEMLLRSRISPEIILGKTLTGLEGSSCQVTFGQALPAVVETAIEYNRETSSSPLKAKTNPSCQIWNPRKIANR